MSSLAVGCALEWEPWLGGLFTAADLAAADLLLQLRLGEAAAAASTTTSRSQRSASSCWEDLPVDEEERMVKETAVPLGSIELDCRTGKSSATSCCEDLAVEEEERVVKERALPLGSMELDRRAKKRYRVLSELYAATRPAKAAAPASKKKRKKYHDHDGGESAGSWSEKATRYGDY